EAYVRLVPRLVRWAASGAEFERFQLTARGRGTGEPVDIRLVELDEKFLPAEGSRIQVRLSSIAPDGAERTVLETEVAVGSGGSARWQPVLDEPGVYRVRAVFDAGAAVREAVLALNNPPGELLYASADLPALQRLAHDSGGRVVPPGEVPQLMEQLGRDRTY